jgi:hypothetical protein
MKAQQNDLTYLLGQVSIEVAMRNYRRMLDHMDCRMIWRR